jgi:hypothetical protein
MTVAQLIKGESKYRYFESGRIPLGYAIRSNDRDTWICILVLQVFIQNALCCEDNHPKHFSSLSRNVSFTFKATEKKKSNLRFYYCLQNIIVYSFQFPKSGHGSITTTTLEGYTRRRYAVGLRLMATCGCVSQSNDGQS